MIPRIALVGALVALGACADVTAPSGPPIAGTSLGTAAPPINAVVTQQPHSDSVSAGTPTITGTNSEGRPIIDRSGTPSGNLGGVPPVWRLPRSSN